MPKIEVYPTPRNRQSATFLPPHPKAGQVFMCLGGVVEPNWGLFFKQPATGETLVECDPGAIVWISK